jgi:hypothetical protein
MPAFEPEKIFAILERHHVDYVLIGGLAATLHGSNLRTGDVDVRPSRTPQNLAKLATALMELGARIRAPDSPSGLPFACDAKFLAQMELCNLTTRFGDFDVSFRPSGTDGYPDLRRHAVDFELGDLMVPTASLDDIIRSKKAAARPKDLAQLPTLRSLRRLAVKRKSAPD